MAVPGAPTDLSAESTNSTTIELRWIAPDDDGGFSIDGYFIERNLNDAGFATLVADTGDALVAYTDSTLSAQDNAVYRVSAINTEGTGLPSDTDSATTATSEAQTIQELLFNNWSLTGELSKTVVGEMNQVVNFFNRGQIPGNKKSKAVVVQKINELGNENIVEHPKFFEQSDTFEVSCFLQVPTAADDVFSVWIDLIQQMTSEVVRILKTAYSPSTTTGEFFRTNTAWTKDDTFAPDDAMLARTLRFTLTRLVATTEEVFLGYGGVLAFDASTSSGDSLPLTDYIYTEVQRVQTVQGWRNIPYVTTDSPGPVAIPIYYRGAFGGQFSCQMFLKKTDFEFGTLNFLNQIFLPQSNGELGTAVFLQNNNNTQSSPTVTLTESIPVNITSIDKISETEELVTIALRGNLTAPSTFDIDEVINMAYEDGGLMEYEDTDLMQYEN
jgi:hypothetical protein